VVDCRCYGPQIARLSSGVLYLDGNGGITVRFIQMVSLAVLLLAVFLSVSATATLADTTDPILSTKGCGGRGQPACDALILGPGQTGGTLSETFTCDSLGNCTADESIINETGAPLSSFTLSWHTMGLTFTCAEGGFFICSPINDTKELLTGGPLCSTDSNDVSVGEGGAITFHADGDSDDSCFGVTVELKGTTGEGLSNDETITASFSTPEPSSGLLLLFGLLVGAVGLKYFRTAIV